MPILAYGPVGFQTIRTPFASAERVIGGSAAVFAVAASYFDRVHLLAGVGEDFGQGERAFLEERAVDLRGLEVLPGKSWAASGEYGFGMAEKKRLELSENAIGSFDPVLPYDYQDAPMVFLGDADPAGQRRVLHQVRNPALVVARTSEHWIASEPASLQETLLEVDLVVLDETEARVLAREEDLRLAARLIREMGPTTLLVLRHGGGGLAFREDGILTCPGYPLEAVRDPSVRADSFAGGLLGYLASQGDSSDDSFRKGILCGAVLGSFAVESTGLGRLRRLEEPEFRGRYLEFKRLLRFDERSEPDRPKDIASLED